MAFDNIRRLASPGAYNSIGTDPMEPPDQTPGISPITPGPNPIAATTARGLGRANRMREFLAANPDRRPAPMGRRADGSIAYDESIYGSNYLVPTGGKPGGQHDNVGPADPVKIGNAGAVGPLKPTQPDKPVLPGKYGDGEKKSAMAKLLGSAGGMAGVPQYRGLGGF